MNRFPHRKSDWKQSKKYFDRRWAENPANAGYNEAEYQVWLAKKQGITCQITLAFIFRIHAHTLHKCNLKIEKLSKEIEKIVSNTID